ncbi:MAG: hypothetical protein KDA75_10730, partial [Planctomycetaceae bacterium]|nr:hypothetical protein [Planctomycetaceae bacterium]
MNHVNVSPKLPPLLPLAETDRQVVMELRDALLEPGVVLLEPGVVLLAAPAPACYSAEYFRLATDEILKPEPGAGQSPPSDPGTGGDFGSIAAVRLRCDSEAALQADLVAFNRRLGYPERLARASDHPRIGLFRFLAKSPSTVVCLEGL